MMPGFTKGYEIHYFEIDQSGEASPVSLLHFLQDSAIAHSESVGLGIDRLLAGGTCWVLNRWLLRIEKYPKLGEKISIRTWPSKFERFYARREFIIEDPQGSLLGRAGSLWVYLNVDKKRPVRIPEHFSQVYNLTNTTVMDYSFKDSPGMTGTQPGMVFHVRRSDIDTNGHVNNARYVEWMIEGMSEDLTRDYQLCELEVAYKKETVYGTDIYSECQMISQLPPVCLHRIMDKTKTQELAQGKTLWSKRQASGEGKDCPFK